MVRSPNVVYRQMRNYVHYKNKSLIHYPNSMLILNNFRDVFQLSLLYSVPKLI